MADQNNVNGVTVNLQELVKTINSLIGSSNSTDLSQIIAQVKQFNEQTKLLTKSLTASAKSVEKLGDSSKVFAQIIREVQVLENRLNSLSKVKLTANTSELAKIAQTVSNVMASLNKVQMPQTSMPDLTSQIASIKQLQQLAVNIQTTFKSIDVAKSFPNIDQFVSNLNSMEQKFNELAQTTQRISTVTQEVKSLSDALKQVKSSVKSFEDLSKTITGLSPVHLNTLMSPLNKMMNMAEKLDTAFSNLGEKNVQFTYVTESVQELCDVFNSLTRLATQYQETVKSLTISVDANQLKNVQELFSKMISTAENLTIMSGMFQGLNTEFSQYETTVIRAYNVMNLMNDSVQMFLQLVENAKGVEFAPQLQQTFSDIATTVQNVGNSFSQSSLFNDIPVLYERLQQLSGAVREIANTVQSFQEIPSLDINAEALQQISVNMQGLISLVNELQARTQDLTGFSANIKEIADSMKSLSTIVNSMNKMAKLTDKFADPEQVRKLTANLRELTPVITQIVEQLNSLQVNAENLQGIGSALQGLSGIMNQMSRGQRTVTEQQQRLSSASRQAGQSISSMGRDAKDGFSWVDYGVRNSINRLTMMNSVVGRVTYGIHGLMALLGGRLTYNWLLDSNAYIEDLNTSLTVTLKNANKAEQVIRSMRSYAALTPFNETEVFSGAEMLASNQMDIDRWMKTAGNLASAKKVQGTSLNDVINVITRINSGDFGKAMIRLRQMGISMKDLKQKGLEFSKSGTFLGDTDQMLDALEQIINERFGGLTESLSETFNGVKSNIEDIIYMLGVDLGEGPFEKIKSYMIDFQEYLQNVKTDSTNMFGNEFFNFDFYDLKEEINQIFQYVEGILKSVGELGKFFSFALKGTKEILQLFITFNISKAILGIVKNISVAIRNAQMLNTTQQSLVGLLYNQQNNLINQNAQFTWMQKKVALLNALHEHRKELLTQETAQLAMQQSLLQAGVNSRGFDVATAGALMKVKGYNLTQAYTNQQGILVPPTGKIDDGTPVPTGNAIIPVLNKAMIGIMATSLFFQITGGIMNKLKSDNAPKVSVKDLDTQISNINTEVAKMKELNSTRAYAKQNVDIYTKALKEAKQSSDGSAKAMEHENYIASQLEEAKSNLTRANEQLVRMSPGLINTMYNEKGELSDLTDGYDANTQAILDNINAKKALASQKFYQEMDVAKYNITDYENKIKDNEAFIDALNMKNVNVVDYAAFGVESLVDGIATLFGQPDWMETVMDTFTGSGEYSAKYKSFSYVLDGITGGGKTEQAILDTKIKNQEYKQGILDSQATLNKETEMQNLGFYERDSSGHIVYESDGRPRYDVQGYEAYLKKLEDQKTTDLDNVESISTRLQDLSKETYNEYAKVEKEWKLKYEQALNRAGGDKDDANVKEIEALMIESMNEVLNEGLGEIQELYDRTSVNLEEKMKELSPALRDLAEAGLSKETIYSALVQYEEKGDIALQGLKQYADKLKQVYDGLVSKGIDLSYVLELMRNTEQIDMLKDTLKDIKTDIETDKLKNVNSLFDSSKKSSGKSAYQLFKSEWEDKTQVSSLNNSLQLQQLQIQGYTQDSATYRAKQKQLNLQLADEYSTRINALKSFIASGNFKDADEARQAQIDLLKLQKEQNQLLIDIKKNTDSMLGEFNVPGEMRAMTLYDYKAREANGYQVQVGNAEFVLKIDKVETQADAEKAVKLIYQQMNPNKLSGSEYSGVSRPDVYR